jgi:hypothetical protein
MMRIVIEKIFQQRRRALRCRSKAAASILCPLALGVLSFNAAAEPSVYPTGVTRYDPAKAFNSYVLFSGADKITHLIDLNGNVVHEWKYPGFPSVVLDPALIGGKRGHVLVTLASIDASGTGLVPGGAVLDVTKTIGELDWDGKTVWEWGGDNAPGGAAQQHHDWRRLPNGNTLILANLLHPVPGFAQPKVLDDGEHKKLWGAPQAAAAVAGMLESLAANPEYHFSKVPRRAPSRV